MEHELTKKWILAGIVAGLLTTFIYPSLLFVPWPILAVVILTALFGTLLIVSTIGLYHFLRLHSKTVTLQLGALFNIISAAFVIAMIYVQLSTRHFISESAESLGTDPEGIRNFVSVSLHGVQLGLDVTWDVFIAAGTFLLALNMYHHPRLGKIFSVSGVLIGLALLTLNFLTFPVPPAELGSVDLGPLMGIWYLLVTIRIITSWNWVKSELA